MGGVSARPAPSRARSAVASPRVKVFSLGKSEEGREMIAVAVSSQNRCYYCLTAHGAAVRQYSGNPLLGEHLVMNYRVARLNKRQRAMLDFAVKLTASPWSVEEGDRERLRRVFERFDLLAAPAMPVCSSTCSTRRPGMRLLVARTRRWSRARRPGSRTALRRCP